MTRARLLHIALFLALPFLLLGWTIPWPGHTTIGVDYPIFSLNHQLALFFSLQHGSFPLYIPGFSGGQTSAALTLGQIYHPIAWVARLIPGYASGGALLNLTCLRLLSLGAAQLLLYGLLRRIGGNACWAFICSFIAIYNMRMLDCFRFAASLESYTGFIFTCVALGYVWLEQQKRRQLLWLIASAYWLLCSGHPQMAYYGCLGAALFGMLFPFITAAMQDQPRPEWPALSRYYFRCAVCALWVVLLSAAYIVPYYLDFMRSNCGRVNQDYGYSLAWSDSVIGVWDSLFFPLRGDVYDSFGGSALLCVVLLTPLLAHRHRILSYILFSLCTLTFVCLMGAATPLHYWLWQILPFAGSMRAPGRLGLFLPMLIALLLFLVASQQKTSQRNFRRACGLAVIYLLYSSFMFTHNIISANAPIHIRPDITLGVELLTQCLGAACLVVLAFLWHNPTRAWQRALVCCVVLHSALIMHYGTWITPAKPSFTLAEYQQVYHGVPGHFPLEEGVGLGSKEVCDYRIGVNNTGIPKEVQEFYLQRPLAMLHIRFASIARKEDFFATLQHPNTALLLVEDFHTPQQLIPPFHPSESTIEGNVQLSHSSYNHMVFHVHTNNPAFLALNYPYSEHWQAWLNDAPAATYRVNGFYLAVAVQPGDSTIEFRYIDEAQTMGMAISLAVLAMLGCLIASHTLPPKKRYAAMLLCMTASALLFALWQHSLYHGEDLGGQYEWKTP